MTAATAKTNGKPQTREEELLRALREAVALYPSQSGAAKAVTSRRITQIQVTLDTDHPEVEYEFWTKPEPITTRSYTHTPEELVSRIERLREQMKRTDRPAVHLAAVDRELTNALEQASKRNIEVPS